MVTLDNRIVNVGSFKGDLEAGRRDYERAKQGLELIQGDRLELEEALKAHTGFRELNIPDEPVETTIARGNVKFIIESHSKTKRPPYKTAVEGMENYLDGLYFLMTRGVQIPGVFQQGQSTFMKVGDLLLEFNIIVGGILKPGVYHSIRCEVYGGIAHEKPLDELVLKAGRRPSALTEDNFANYVRMDRLVPILAAYVESFESELVKGQRKPEAIVPVTTRSAYKTTKSKPEGPDWAYVVKTLVTVPTDPKHAGELNILNDAALSKAEKERRLPYYDLIYAHSDAARILHVSIQSVYGRIQTLKEGPAIEAKRLRVEPREIV